MPPLRIRVPRARTQKRYRGANAHGPHACGPYNARETTGKPCTGGVANIRGGVLISGLRAAAARRLAYETRLRAQTPPRKARQQPCRWEANAFFDSQSPAS